MIITIDGPAGAGKSSVARGLAKSLGFRYLDTGAMYRAVTFAVLRQKLSWDDHQAIASLARSSAITFQGSRVFLDDQEVTQEIRTSEVTAAVRYAADNAEVRQYLVELQREIAQRENNMVSEGRDQGSVVFPNAEYKFFLTASAEERARRRHQEQNNSADSASYDEILDAQNKRDEEDFARAVGPLLKPTDAREICTDGRSLDQVVEKLKQIVLSQTSSS